MLDDLNELRTFQRILVCGSLSAAARDLGVGLAVVSKRLMALERRAGQRLINRTTRTLSATNEGLALMVHVDRILEELEAAESRMTMGGEEPFGMLRVSSPISFGRIHLVPLVAELVERHPKLDIELRLDDRLIDLTYERIDVAVRIGDLPDSNQHAIRVGEVRRVICASPGYLQTHGRPRHPEELAGAPVVATSSIGQLRNWPFLDKGQPISVRPEPRLVVTANQAAITAACLGLGFTRVLSYQVAGKVAAGELEIVLADFELAPLPIHIVYQGGRKAPARIRSFVDFMVRALREHPALG